jgi:hypothetical protein
MENKMNKWSTEDFYGSGNILYDTIIMSTFVQTHRTYNQEGIPM